MDLPMTATWSNCSGSGTHPSSVRKAERDRGISGLEQPLNKWSGILKADKYMQVMELWLHS